jgi:hypothetical protein
MSFQPVWAHITRNTSIITRGVRHSPPSRAEIKNDHDARVAHSIRKRRRLSEATVVGEGKSLNGARYLTLSNGQVIRTLKISGRTGMPKKTSHLTSRLIISETMKAM